MSKGATYYANATHFVSVLFRLGDNETFRVHAKNNPHKVLASYDTRRDPEASTKAVDDADRRDANPTQD